MCLHFSFRMRDLRIPTKTREAIWEYVRKYGYVCYYTKMPLEMTEYRSPWYCEFDHCTPGNPRKIVITSALLNNMKSDLTEREFWYYILQLDDHRRKHTKVKKRKPSHWNRLYPTYNNKICPICGKKIFVTHYKYCTQCAHFAHRLNRKFFPKKTVEAIWNYIHQYGYVCYYTGMSLVLNDPHDPWYCVFDHWIPRNPKKVVITSYLLNDMKSDLTEKEFFNFIRQLANFLRKGTKVKRFKTTYWDRPYAGK